jgi:hypothetical protein
MTSQAITALADRLSPHVPLGKTRLETLQGNRLNKLLTLQ